MTRKALIFSLIIACATSPLSFAHMQGISDSELATVQANTGISLQISTNISAGFLRYENSENNKYLEYQNVTLGNGSGGPLKSNGDILLDVGTSAGRSCLIMTLPETDPSGDGLYWAAQSIDFNGYNAGSLAIEDWRHSETYYRIGPHTDGSTGISLSLETNWNVDRLEYEIGGDAFALNGLYLSDTPGGDARWPAPGGGQAIIGAGNWAEMDIGFDGSKTYLALDIPLQGTLRINNVSLASENFGAVVADNIDGNVRIKYPAGASWQY